MVRLIIKEYLSYLKEKDELDLLLCDLLFQMGYNMNSIPTTGNRQYGVDIRADNDNEIMLLVVKQGDIDRKNWDSGQNAVRQSLNEIKDCYLQNIVCENKKKKLHIIVATNGNIAEAVLPNWNGYVNSQSQWGEMITKIEFWGIDIITDLIEKHLLNEHIFNKEMQSLLRRALYYIEESDYRNTYYERIINLHFSQLQNTHDKKSNKTLSSMFLSTQMIAHYAANCEKFKISIMVTEYLIIRYWKYMLDNNLLENSHYIQFLYQITEQYEIWNRKYHSAVEYCCHGKRRLCVGNAVEQRVILFELLGYLVSYAYYLSFEIEIRHNLSTELSAVIETIVSLINNYPDLQYLPYDNHVSILSMLYRLLDRLKRSNEVASLIIEVCKTTMLYYQKYHKYPSPADSFEDAISIDMEHPSEEYLSSGFWGTQLAWIVLYDQKDLYQEIHPFLSSDLGKVTKCIWIVSAKEESMFYDLNAMHLSGAGTAFNVVDSYDAFSENVKQILTKTTSDVFSFDEYQFPALEFITCRYYGYLPRIKREMVENE